MDNLIVFITSHGLPTVAYVLKRSGGVGLIKQAPTRIEQAGSNWSIISFPLPFPLLQQTDQLECSS